MHMLCMCVQITGPGFRDRCQTPRPWDWNSSGVGRCVSLGRKLSLVFSSLSLVLFTCSVTFYKRRRVDKLEATKLRIRIQ